MIRVVLPAHLRALTRTNDEIILDLLPPITLHSVLDTLEERYPMLLGTIRDQISKARRPYVRFFACERDLSHQSPAALLPDAVSGGSEPLLIVGAMSGG
ncbi:MAG: MoaD/ThiS family protein [Candidatus Eremiobacteraeota bacterium]|nr:MoaD/ThiS family protein [Candidatus Eremiobacteraeota bacterium]